MKTSRASEGFLRPSLGDRRVRVQKGAGTPDLTMTPREDAAGREYAITGRLVLGDALDLGATAPSHQDQARGRGVAYSPRPRRDSEHFRIAEDLIVAMRLVV